MADSAPETTQPSPTTGGADAVQPYVDNAKETIKSILEEPAMDAFLREHIQKIPEWDSWSDAARQAYAHMMTAQLLQRKAAATQIGIGHPFKLPDYSAIKNLGLLLQRKPLPPPPKKKRKKKAAPAADAPASENGELPTEESAALPETEITETNEAPPAEATEVASAEATQATAGTEGTESAASEEKAAA
jgi:hypothetical protein